METRASPFIVGLFTLAAIIGAFLFTYWFGRYDQTVRAVQYRVVFADAVTGLSPGAQVLFNGIKVGEVERLSLAEDDPTQVIALINVDPATPVNVDTKAEITLVTLSGAPALQLSSGLPDSPRLREAWGADTPPIIYAEPAADILQSAQTALGRIEDLATRLDDLVAANSGSIATTIRNVEEFTTALAGESDSVGTFLSDISAAARRFDTLGTRLEELTANLETRLDAIDPEAVRETIENVRSFTGTLDDNSENIGALIADAGAAARRLEQLAARLETAGDRAVEIVEAVDPAKIGSAVDGIEKFSATLSGKTETVDQFIDDAAAIAAQFRATSERIDALVSKVDAILGEDTGSFFADAAGAARSVRELADDLRGRLDGITADLSRFTGRGLRDVESLVADGRRVLANIDRVVTRLEQNPGRFLTGGTQVREYSGGARR